MGAYRLKSTKFNVRFENKAGYGFLRQLILSVSHCMRITINLENFSSTFYIHVAIGTRVMKLLDQEVHTKDKVDKYLSSIV